MKMFDSLNPVSRAVGVAAAAAIAGRFVDIREWK
jgi:uncharacterized protein (DUF4213/DUF364 family)